MGLVGLGAAQDRAGALIFFLLTLLFHIDYFVWIFLPPLNLPSFSASPSSALLAVNYQMLLELALTPELQHLLKS